MHLVSETGLLGRASIHDRGPNSAPRGNSPKVQNKPRMWTNVGADLELLATKQTNSGKTSSTTMFPAHHPTRKPNGGASPSHSSRDPGWAISRRQFCHWLVCVLRPASLLHPHRRYPSRPGPRAVSQGPIPPGRRRASRSWGWRRRLFPLAAGG